ncbi:MAG: amino acid permease [Sphingobacteriia bacterium]|nr:amino acid permease [Sphingobacteriia bacterium]
MNCFRKQPLVRIRQEAEELSLKKSLNVYDLIMLGIGAIIGVGAFVLTGIAAARYAGPAITTSYLISGFVCLFVGLLYVELAGIVPASGSSYSYAYASMGEIVAWFVFWFMMMEYTTGSSMIAVGWGGYLSGMLKTAGFAIPKYLELTPFEGGLFNLPAFLIVWFVTILLIKGTKESSLFNIILVLIKVIAIVIFLIIAIPHFNFEYWENFMPYGARGVGTGAATLILAYAGFDQLASTTEEAKNPKRDLPIAMFSSLVICALIYMSIAAALTLIVPYKTLDNAEPMAYALRANGSLVGSGLVAIGAIAGITTSLIVQIFGQSRTIFAISRDGLIPSKLSKVNKKFGTPVVSTIFVGIVVSLIAALVPLDFVGKLANIGTLVSFITVAIGVVIMRITYPNAERSFRCPAIWLIAPIALISCIYLLGDLLITTWDVCLIWVALGLILYFGYGFKHSLLSKKH